MSQKKGATSNNDSDVGRLEKAIDFMRHRYIAMIVSAILLLASIGSLSINGLQFGLDFTGGLQIEPQYSEPVDLESVRGSLEANGFKDAVVVYFGSDRDLKITTQQDRESLVKTQLANAIDGLLADNIAIDVVTTATAAGLPKGAVILNVTETDLPADSVLNHLKNIDVQNYTAAPLQGNGFTVSSEDGLQVLAEKLLIDTLESSSNASVTIKRTEFVGPQVGDELRDQGGIGMLFALAIVMVYVALRFQFKFSVAAVAALIHDVIIVLGFFSFFKFDFDLTVLAAVLAVIGYSLNDTIVVADRIRENFRKLRQVDAEGVINISLTQTLGRTLVTSFTTLLVLLALFFVGGELIHAFSVALIIGVLVGTYSSVYVAANILLIMSISKEDLMLPVKEGDGIEIDEMP